MWLSIPGLQFACLLGVRENISPPKRRNSIGIVWNGDSGWLRSYHNATKPCPPTERILSNGAIHSDLAGCSIAGFWNVRFRHQASVGKWRARGDDSLNSTESRLSTGLVGCLLSGRELVKSLHLSSDCGGTGSLYSWQGTKHPAGKLAWGRGWVQMSTMVSIGSRLVLRTGCSQDAEEI